MAKSKAKYSGGGAEYLRRTGKTSVLVYMSAEDKELLRQAAEATGRKLSQYLLFQSLKAAKKDVTEK